MHLDGHQGDCEQFDLSGIAKGIGSRLDEIGADFGIGRNGDDDYAYRLRLWRGATRG